MFRVWGRIPALAVVAGYKVIGSQRRCCINGLGEEIFLIIRRLSCVECNRVHHELPALLVPYKRHVREAVISGDPDLSVAADESTLKGWRAWFNEMADYFQGCLESIAIRYGREPVQNSKGSGSM